MKIKIRFTDKERKEYGKWEWIGLAAWGLKEGWEPWSTARETIPAPNINNENFRIINKESWAGTDEYTIEIPDTTVEAVEEWLQKLDEAGFWGPAY